MPEQKPKSFSKYFKSLDRLGKSLRFKYEKESVLKSRFGATISIFIGVMALMFAVYSGKILIDRSRISHEDYLQRNGVDPDTPVFYNDTRFDIGAIQILVPEVEWPFTDDTIVNDTPWSKYKQEVMKTDFIIEDPKVSSFNLGLHFDSV